jgi:hypothetical protein
MCSALLTQFVIHTDNRFTGYASCNVPAGQQHFKCVCAHEQDPSKKMPCNLTQPGFVDIGLVNKPGGKYPPSSAIAEKMSTSYGQFAWYDWPSGGQSKWNITKSFKSVRASCVLDAVAEAVAKAGKVNCATTCHQKLPSGGNYSICYNQCYTKALGPAAGGVDATIATEAFAEALGTLDGLIQWAG